MKQVSQNYKSGKVTLEEVPAPALRAGGILVRSSFSAISAGTEGMKVREGKLSYVGKARARPDQVKKVLASVRQQGLFATYQKVMNKLDSLTPLGYSLSGEVIAVGAGAEEFQVGQRVACAGAGYANHAEINFVPKNLAVPVPDNVALKHAAFATTGAIALQGVRQAELRLGEVACVIGLGLLGQLAVQLLRAAGVHVIGVDLNSARCQLAIQLGAKAARTPADLGLLGVIERQTGGVGVDCVIIAAGGPDNSATELAIEIARDRARIVDIGKTRLDLPWNDCYMKELEFRFSRSYGPGRYDPMYEERGVDYPIGYVRWTERRNMLAFLDLLSEGRVKLDPIVTSIKPFGLAEQVYQELAEGKSDSLGTVFEYAGAQESSLEATRFEVKAQFRNAASRAVSRIGLIGAGNYASSMLLPHLRKNPDVNLAMVATATSLSGQNAKRKFGFERVSTDYGQLLVQPDIDAVVIATRHSAHARMVCESILAEKTTYVEKPLALTIKELSSIRRAISDSGNSRLMVGFNRRFSPMVQEIEETFRSLDAPLVLNYRVHAGKLDGSSWYLDRSEGSRFVGEAGHFFDVMAFVTGSRPVSVFAQSLRPGKSVPDDIDNVVAVVRYANGSVGTLQYLTHGGTKLPKELLEVFGGGVTAELRNFESLWLYERDSARKCRIKGMDKGQGAEMVAFVEAVKSGSHMPINLQDLLDTTYLTLAANESLQTGKPVAIDDLWRRTIEEETSTNKTQHQGPV